MLRSSFLCHYLLQKYLRRVRGLYRDQPICPTLGPWQGQRLHYRKSCPIERQYKPHEILNFLVSKKQNETGEVNMYFLIQNMQNIIIAIYNRKARKYFTLFFKIKSSKSGVHFILKAHFDSDQSHLKYSIVTGSSRLRYWTAALVNSLIFVSTLTSTSNFFQSWLKSIHHLQQSHSSSPTSCSRLSIKIGREARKTRSLPKTTLYFLGTFPSHSGRKFCIGLIIFFSPLSTSVNLGDLFKILNYYP